MFEFDKYENRLHAKAPSTPSLKYEHVRNICQMSFLKWGEHCIECAAPLCFLTCDLYQKRPDQRCRRFVFGTYKNKNFHSYRGYGAEITFKKWAKVETRGNTLLTSSHLLVWGENLIEFVLPFINGLGFLLHKVTRNTCWCYVSFSLQERLCRWLHQRSSHSPNKPDAFLLEIYNPASYAINIQLAIGIATYALKGAVNPSKIPPRFVTTITLKSGYSKHELDRRFFQSITDARMPFDISLTPERETIATIVILSADFVKYRKMDKHKKKGELITKPNIKCVVLDLDNTLWGGILLENENVHVNPTALDLIKFLDSRGVLLSIASKNSYDHAWGKIKELGIAEYFLFPQIDWTPKSEGIKRIADQLNIGLDTFAFIDDNPFELAEVSQSLPTVTCLNVDEIKNLFTHPRFKGSISSDAKRRRQYYKDAIIREKTLKASTHEDYIDFLESCDIVLNVRKFTIKDLERVTELAQRTNQLNFSGKKYKREEIQSILDDSSLEKYVLSCSDRFGTYGTIGFAIVKRKDGNISVLDFMLSCRIQGKFIEKAFFSFLQSSHKPNIPSHLWVNYQPTDRNKSAQQVLDAMHFKPVDSGSGLSLDLIAHDLLCTFIKITSSDD